MNTVSDPRFRVPLLVATALVVQLAVLARLHVLGVTPDLMLLLAVTGGIVGGPVRGAILGFAAGIAIDVFLRTPLGQSALVFSIVGYSVGVLFTGVLTPTWYLPLLTASVGSGAGAVLFAVVGAMLGEPMVTSRLGRIVAGLALTSAFLSWPTARAATWALLADAHPRELNR